MKNYKFKIVGLLFFWGSVNLYSQKQDSTEVPDNAIQLCKENLKWVDAPAPLPAGAKMCIMEGSPKKEGTFTVRFILPPNFKIPAHFHLKDERVTIISGEVFIGFGDELNMDKATKFTSGCYYVNPAESHHYVFTKKKEAVIQINGIGPWSLEYLKK